MLYLSGVAQRQFVFNIIKVNIHSQRFSQNAQLRTNMTVADDTQLLPRASKDPAASLFHTPRCALALASGTPRNSSSSSPITSSATERVFENGALNTGIPRFAAASRSTSFVPIQKQPIATSFSAALITSSVRWVRDRRPMKWASRMDSFNCSSSSAPL